MVTNQAPQHGRWSRSASTCPRPRRRSRGTWRTPRGTTGSSRGPLVGGGAAKAAAALVLALHRQPGGMFLRGEAPFYAYYGALVAAALLGALEVAVGFWVAGEPERRRGWGRLALWASVIPLVFVAGLGGFAVLK